MPCLFTGNYWTFARQYRVYISSFHASQVENSVTFLLLVMPQLQFKSRFFPFHFFRVPTFVVKSILPVSLPLFLYLDVPKRSCIVSMVIYCFWLLLCLGSLLSTTGRDLVNNIILQIPRKGKNSLLASEWCDNEQNFARVVGRCSAHQSRLRCHSSRFWAFVSYWNFPMACRNSFEHQVEGEYQEKVETTSKISTHLQLVSITRSVKELETCGK